MQSNEIVVLALLLNLGEPLRLIEIHRFGSDRALTRGPQVEPIADFFCPGLGLLGVYPEH